MKNKKTSINVNIIPELIAGTLVLDAFLLLLLILYPFIADGATKEDIRTVQIVLGVVMILMLLLQTITMKMATFDERGIIFHKWFWFKKIDTVPYSEIKKITLITAFVNLSRGFTYADYITIYLDENSEELVERMENMPKGIYWQIIATKHNLQVFEKYRKRYFPEIEIEDHRHKNAKERDLDPYYTDIWMKNTPFDTRVKSDKKGKSKNKH